jgi:diguanylate cyclase (GGDEF)-like protein/PAS domain S-box-containing protein
MRSPARVLVVGALLLAGLLSAFVISLAGSQSKTRHDTSTRYGDRAKLSAALVGSLFVTSSRVSRAENPKRFGARRVRADDLTTWTRARRDETAVLLDGTGAVLAASSNTPAALVRTIRARPAYIRRALAGRPFALSNVLRFQGRPSAIEFAQSFMTRHGRRVLVTGFEPRLLSAFFGWYLHQVPNPGGHAYVLDANGIVVGAPTPDPEPWQRLGEARLMEALQRGPAGTFGATYFASSPVQGTEWRLVLTAPEARLFGSVSGARKWLPWIIIAAFALVSAVALFLLQRSMRSAADLQQSQERYTLVVRGANDGIWDRDLVTGSLYLSSRWKEILGLPIDVDETVDQWLSRVHPDDRVAVQEAFRAHLEGRTATLETEHRILHHDGSWRWTLVRGVATRDDEGRPTRMAGSMTDITAAKVAEEQLLRDARHDALTGLANRTLFLDRLEASLAEGADDVQRHCAVLFLDLDRFKLINDSFSHSVGDELLVELGRRLTAVLRPGDMIARGGPDSTIARLGGDEFTILLDAVHSADAAAQAAERILRDLERPFLLQGRRVFVSASIGIALSPPGTTAAEMMRSADLAMYEAKRQGKARWSVYNDTLHEEVTTRLQVELALRTAIEERSLRVFYQPVIDLQTGAVTGFEALARWPEHLPPVTPDVFIPVAEETGLIDGLGRLVLFSACAQLNDWRTQGVVGEDATMSVNVSGSQLSDPAVLIADVGAALRHCGLPPRALRLEITEGTIIREPERVHATLDALERIGVRAHIDDFGTGYSSLSFLHHFPGETLKIDRSFISSMHEDGGHFEIVRAIVSLAHSLTLKTVAEGIDDPDQLVLLRGLGCEHGQGFLFARPLEAAGVPAFVTGWDPTVVLPASAPVSS